MFHKNPYINDCVTKKRNNRTAPTSADTDEHGLMGVNMFFHLRPFIKTRANPRPRIEDEWLSSCLMSLIVALCVQWYELVEL